MPYTPTNWQNQPSTVTPLSAANLNHLEAGVAAAYIIGAGGLTNADIAAAAGIAYSKLALTNSIVNADIAAAAAINYSKLALTGTILNADLAGSIAFSKLLGYPSDATKFARGDGTWATASALTYRKTTAKAVNTTVAATDLLNGEITVAAGALGSTGALRLTAYGDFLGNAAFTAFPRLQLVLGGTTLVDTNAVSMGSGSSATRFPWEVTATIINSAAAAQVTIFNYRLYASYATTGSSIAFAVGTGVMKCDQAQSANFVDGLGVNGTTVNTAASAALVLNVINGVSSASYETRLLNALVEIL